MHTTDLREEIIKAGRIAVKELIKVAKEAIITNDEDNLSADKLKSAAQAKRIAIEDAFAILDKIDAQESAIGLSNNTADIRIVDTKGFAEKRSSK
jgi:hypothetical protein